MLEHEVNLELTISRDQALSIIEENDVTKELYIDFDVDDVTSKVLLQHNFKEKFIKHIED